MDFQFDICNTEASQLKAGDYILYDSELSELLTIKFISLANMDI